MVRNPKSYVNSAISKLHGKSNSYTLYGENDPRDRLSAKDFPDDPFRDQWDEFTQFQKLCWHWQKYNSLIERSLTNPDRVTLVRFEDIFYGKDKWIVIERVIDFLGITIDLGFSKSVLLDTLAEKRNTSNRDVLKNYDSWSHEHKKQYQEIIGNTPVKYGYA